MIVDEINLKTIPGFPNYAITKDGRVWSKPRTDSIYRLRGGRWLTPQKTKNGKYLRVKLCVNGLVFRIQVHSLVLETFVGPCPDGMECRHLDGNPSNNKLDNLKWGTKSENAQDAIRHGTHSSIHNYGEKHPSTKLRNIDVKNIKSLRQTFGFSLESIASLFGVTKQHVCKICLGHKRGYVLLD